MLSPFNQPQRAPAEFRIRIDDQEVADYYPFVREILVETSRKDPWAATLRFATRRDEFGRWSVQDDGRLVRWAEVALIMVFGGDEDTLFKGFIREVNTSFPENAGEAEIRVECQDQSLRLDRDHPRDPWGTETAPMTDRLVASDILSRYHLSLTPDSENGRENLIELPQNDSDIAFLRKRAEVNDFELIFYPDQVYFGPPRLDGAASQAPIMVYAGQATNCLSIDVAADGHLPDAVAYDLPVNDDGGRSDTEVVSSNLEPMGPERADSREAPLEPHIEKLNGASGESAEQLAAKAQAKINDIDLHRVQAEGELDGSLYGQVLQPGLTVPVDGLGERLSGLYYVDRVSHQITPDGYRQAFSLLRNAYGDNLDQVQSVSSRLAAVI